MQLFSSFGDEDGGSDGLGWIKGKVKKISLKDLSLKLPHMGWNKVKGSGVLFEKIPNDSHFYLVHSYYAKPNENTVGHCLYDINFAAAMAKNNFYGTQFHPEKSGATGAQLLQNFLSL